MIVLSTPSIPTILKANALEAISPHLMINLSGIEKKPAKVPTFSSMKDKEKITLNSLSIILKKNKSY